MKTKAITGAKESIDVLKKTNQISVQFIEQLKKKDEINAKRIEQLEQKINGLDSIIQAVQTFNKK
jgi:hypothetical protein